MKYPIIKSDLVPDSKALFREEDGAVIQTYKSWSDFLYDVFEVSPSIPNNYYPERLRKEWNGIDGSAADVKRVIDLGWDDGNKLFHELKNSLPKDLYDKIVPPLDYKKEWTSSLDTGELSVDAYLRGEAECFITERYNETEIKAGNKLVTIAFNLSQSCSQPPAILAMQGIMVYGLVEHLESLGFSTQVVCCQSIAFKTLNDTLDYQVEVPIKDFGDMFDRHKMLISLVAPFMLRFLVFCVESLYPNKECVREWFFRGCCFAFPTKARSRGGLLFESINPQEFDTLIKKFKGQMESFIKELEN